MKTEKQQASELEVVHNSAMSENNTEETSQIDELESASTQELVISCYTAKLYNPNILNSCLTGKMPVPLIQIKCTTAYQHQKQHKIHQYQ